jgi:hypothetical protein
MAPLLALLLLANPVAGPKEGPKPSELAKLYFIAGDLLRARQALEGGQGKDPKVEPMLKELADYQFLLSKADRLTAKEAAQLIALDHAFSPLAMAKTTKPIHDRFVAMPLLKAKARLDTPKDALPFAQAAHDADPLDPDALAMLAKLGVDAGTP